MKSIFKIFDIIWKLPRNCLIGVIFIYQKTLSPDHGLIKKFFPYGYCKYTPSCSLYAREVLKKRGAIIGSILAFYRVLRCNPWSDGGFDPPK
jgi:uncharacterized protein